MAKVDEGPIIDIGKTPVPGGAPTGREIGDDEQYIFITGEVGKLDRIEEGDPEWYRIEQDGLNVLRSKSKDLEIATATGLALFKKYGYAGLAAALGMLGEMVNTFWDGLFPERPRRRKALVEGLADRFTEAGNKEPTGWFQSSEPKPDEFDAVDQCLARGEALKAAFLAKLPDEPIALDKFLKALKERAGRRPKPQEAAPAAAPSADGSAAPAAAAPAAGGFVAGEIKDAGAALNAVLSAATFLRKADPTDPVPYAVVRIIKWSKIQLPTTDAAKFQIPPPEAATMDALQHQMANNLWEHLLKNSEAAFRANDPLWLDLQRYTCAALIGQGPTYENAKHAVIALTAGLVRRLGPGLYDLKFNNGKPLCSGETRMWIEAEVCPPTKGGGGGSSDNGKLNEATDKARTLAGGGKVKEAVGALQEGLSQVAHGRERFLWRLRIAQLCLDAQKLGVAASLLEECATDVKRHGIGDWEPGLAVEAAAALYKCRKSLAAADKTPAPETLQSVRESYTWLCQLDPTAALDAEPAGK